jgi:hypothetical protein
MYKHDVTTMIYPVEVDHMQHTQHNTTSTRPRKRSTSSSRSQQSQNFSRPHPQTVPVRKPVPSITTTAPTPQRPSHSHQTTTTLPTRGRSTTRRTKMPTYFLTGANRGIGLEFDRQLAIKPTNTNIAGVRSLSADLSDLKALNTNSNIHIIECDVGSLDSLSSIYFRVAEILSKSGSVRKPRCTNYM